MKRFKFRAYHNGAKEMLYENLTGDVFKWCHEHQDIEIMQFTGLRDKNGKEIYFGDIMRAPSGNMFEVIWYDEEMRIALRSKNTIYNFNVPMYSIAGNIYEHKHLLQ